MAASTSSLWTSPLAETPDSSDQLHSSTTPTVSALPDTTTCTDVRSPPWRFDICWRNRQPPSQLPDSKSRERCHATVHATTNDSTRAACHDHRIDATMHIGSDPCPRWRAVRPVPGPRSYRSDVVVDQTSRATLDPETGNLTGGDHAHGTSLIRLHPLDEWFQGVARCAQYPPPNARGLPWSAAKYPPRSWRTQRER